MLKPLKNDIMNNTSLSILFFKDELQKIRREILPKCENKMLMDDIEKNPFRYLKSMILMNKELEMKGRKMFQPIPLRTEFCNKYVSFNTGAIKDIFGEIKINKKDELDNSKIWEKYFNLRKYKIKNCVFNELISTDGISVSISFINSKEFEKKKEIHRLMAKASKEGKQKIKQMDEEEYDNYIKCKRKKE